MSAIETMLRANLAARRRTVAATLMDVEGSAPLPVGATMLVDESGRIEGSITGGCVESAVVQEAQAILERGAPPAMRTYGVSDELAGTVGLTCGGTVHVLVAELDDAASTALAAFQAAVAIGRAAAIATLADGRRAGARLTLLDGRRSGSLGGPELLDAHVTEDLRGLLAHGRTTLARYGADGARQAAEVRVCLHTKAAPPRMVVFGATDFSAALAPIARQLGYRVTISDPRAAFARAPRFGRDAEVVVGWPAETLARLDLSPADAVLVFSHDPKIDEPALLAALQTEAGYVGALGSRSTVTERERRLRDAGATPEMLGRVFAPCGLDIGSATPDETAIAVLAEIVAHRSGRSGRSLRRTRGPIHVRDASA